MRYLAWPNAGYGDYTTDPAKAMPVREEPEPVDEDWLERFATTASVMHEDFTLRRAAEHGIRAILSHEGSTDRDTQGAGDRGRELRQAHR